MEKKDENEAGNIKAKEAIKDVGKFSSEDIVRYFRFGVFVILMLLLLVATFQFYFFAMSAISTLFTYEYHSLVQAGFAACVIATVVYFLKAVLIKAK